MRNWWELDIAFGAKWYNRETQVLLLLFVKKIEFWTMKYELHFVTSL